MEFKSYAAYLEEAKLYETFISGCKEKGFEKISWDMLLHVPADFIADHYSSVLDEILQDLDKKRTTYFVSRNCNYDILVYFKWLLFFIKRGKEKHFEKELQEIKSIEKKNFDGSKSKEMLVRKSEMFDRTYEKIISALREYTKNDSETLKPEMSVSVYREITKLISWCEENKPVRPGYEAIEKIQPQLLIKESIKEETIDSGKGRGLVFGKIADIPDIFKQRSLQNPYELTVDEKAHIKLREYEYVEISEYLLMMDWLITVSAKKYFK